MGATVKVRLPSAKQRSWHTLETTRSISETAASIIAGSVAIVAAVDAYKENNAAKLFVAMGAVLAMGFSCWNGLLRYLAARKKDQEGADLSHPMHLLAPLRVLYALVAQRKQLTDDEAGRNRFRVTLHAHDDAAGMHEQIVPYVGGKRLPDNAVVGRRWPIRCGIVGQVIRSRTTKLAPISEKVSNEQRYRAEMIEIYGYTDEEALALQPMRMEVLAIPIIGDDGQVIAVVYADSAERNFFDQDTLDLCVTITTAIASHIQRTYAR